MSENIQQVIHRRVVALLAVSLALTPLPRSAQAQAPEAVTMNVSAVVISPLSLSTTHILDFGRVFNGDIKTVAPGALTSGRVEVSGMSGSAINLTLTLPTILTGTGGSTPVVNWNYLLSSNASFSGATPVSVNGGSAVPVAATLPGLTGVSRLYLGFGATIQVPAAVPLGAYTATAQITAAYADL